MRACMFALAVFVTLFTTTARAHGPQIQITIDNNKIVTRRLIFDAPYSSALTAPKSVYAMPLLEFGGVWYSRPNNEIDPILSVPAYFSGPGLAYGHDQADGGPRGFEPDSILSLRFTDGLKRWDGGAFDDAGATELKAFRGSNVGVTSPAEDFAVTSDSGPPFDSLSLAPFSAAYDPESHSTVRFGLLGDGADPLSPSPDGVYLVSLKLSSTQAGLTPSDEYYFVLHKNARAATIAAAASSLGFPASQVQYVPEPLSVVLICIGATAQSALLRRRRPRRCIAP